MSEARLTPLQLSKARKAIEVLSTITDGASESSSSNSGDNKTQEGER